MGITKSNRASADAPVADRLAGVARHTAARAGRRMTNVEQAVSEVAPPQAANVDDISHNLNGQRLGRKGRDTRDRILAAAAELVYAGPRDTPISLSAVARQASLGMTSLYNYFADLTELLVALLDPVMATAEEAYLADLRVRWDDAELSQRCDQFVRAYQEFWARHSRLLHLRNSLSEGMDERMTLCRLRATQPIIRLLCEQMGGNPRAHRSREFGMATVLMIGIERSVTISTDNELPSRLAADIRHDVDHFLRPCARLLEMGIRAERAAGIDTL